MGSQCPNQEGALPWGHGVISRWGSGAPCAGRPHSSVSQCPPPRPGKGALSPNLLWAPPPSASAPQRVACRPRTLRLPRGLSLATHSTALAAETLAAYPSVHSTCHQLDQVGGRASGEGEPSPKTQACDTAVGPPPARLPGAASLRRRRQTRRSSAGPCDESLPSKGF